MKEIRQGADDGFVIIELLVVFLILTLILPTKQLNNINISEDIENKIISNQLEAMAYRKTVVIDSKICPKRDCWFNPKGHINKARTLIVHQGGKQYELVIWLGFGRFKINERVSDD